MMRLIRSRLRAFVVFVVALIVIVGLIVHLAQTLGRIDGPNDGPRALAPWMTPRYVVHHFDISRADLAQVLGLETGAEPNVTLAEIARRVGVAPQEMIARIEALRASTTPAPTTPEPVRND